LLRAHILDDIIEKASDGVISINEAQQIILFNKTAEKIFGYRGNEVLGQDISILLPERNRATHGALISGFSESPERHRPMAGRREVYGRCKNGKLFPAEASISKTTFDDEKVYTVLLRDITIIKRSEADIRRLSRLYAALIQCSQAIVHSSSEEELFPKICQAAVEIGGMKMAWIGLADDTKRMVVPMASSGDSEKYLVGIQISTDADDSAGRGPVGTSIREDTPFWCQDFQNDPRTVPWHERSKKSGWGSSASLPLHLRGKVIGTLALYAGETDSFDKDVCKLLEEMALEIDYALIRYDLENQRKHAESELRIAATAFESQEALMITDADTVILRVNQAFSEITGYAAEELIGQTPKILQSGRHDNAFYEDMWESIHRTGGWQGEIWDRRKNGEIYPKWLSISAVKGDDGKVTHYVGAHKDISKRKAAADEIQKLAFYDPLTELPNRHFLLNLLKKSLVSNQQSGRQGALILIDLDNFKDLNDTLGHEVGDKLLQQVAQRLQSSVSRNDTVARLGGDEFIVLLESLSPKPVEAAVEAESVCEKILTTLGLPYRIDSNEYRSTPSIGTTLYSSDELKADDLLKQADIAMYQAKKAGRNTVRFFDPDMQRAISERAHLEHELRSALGKQQFELYYQIQVDEHHHPFGAEALLRWIHPKRGIVPPKQFIPLAEDTGQILSIGQWVLETACSQIKAWEKSPLTCHLTLAVNVSAKRFQQDDFVAQIQETVHRHAINPMLLKLELTESMLHENIEETISKIDALNEIGIKFSLDDFGTGYSSLQYLKRMPLYQLKIDQSFVRDIATDSNDKVIVSTIIAMAQSLDMDVIAEGVETDEQRQFLLESGCAHFQGYLFGIPAPIGEFETRLKDFS